MKNKYTKVALRLSLILAIVISISVLALSSTVHAVELKDDLGLSTEYALGSEIVIPDGTLIVDGKEYPADAVVYLPNGNALKTDKLTLDSIGRYSIKYTALVGSKYYSKSVEFYAKKTVMSIDGSSSTYYYDKATDSIHLSLAANEVFTFNQPIDLTGRKGSEELISLYIDASSNMSRDFEEFIIVLTDAYDPDNKVYVRVKADHAPQYHPNVWDESSSDYATYGYGLYQAYAGVNFDGGKDWMFYSASTSSIRQTTQWSQGKPVWISFCNRGVENRYESVSTENDTFILGYDDANKTLHVLDLLPHSERPDNTIADLDDIRYFQNNWKGWTTGMVYISIYAQDVATSANIVIKNIDTDKSKEGLISDDLAPMVQVDLGEYAGGNVPDAIVGKPYHIFTATALDENLSNKNVGYKVYYNYNTSYKSLVEVNGDSFIPERAGSYTIVYQSVDDFGNVGETTLEINATNKAKPLSITAESGSAIVGVDSLIPAPILASSDPATGKLHLTVKAKRNGVDDLLYDGLLSEYSPVKYAYMISGEWTIEYTVSDYSRKSVAEAKINVSTDSTIIYESFSSLPIDRYLVCGSTYVLPVVKVVSFTDSETIYTDASIKVVYGNTEKVLDSNILEIDESMGDELEIVYFDKNSENVKIFGTRKIINIGKVYDYRLENLFITSDAEVKATFDDIKLQTSKDATIDFVNKISASELDIRFNLSSAGRSFGKFNIILTDAENPDIQVRLTIENLFNSSSAAAGNSKIYVNGDTSSANTIMSAASFTGLNNRYFDIGYSNISKAIKHDNKSITVTTCVNGDAFEGFTSGAVYVTFEMEDVSGNAEAGIFYINGHSMSEYTEDFGKPVVNVSGSYASTYGIGTTLTTLPAYALDVISGYANATVSIRRIGAGMVSDTNGVKLENVDASKVYDVVLGEYGEYIISYTAYDASGNVSVSNYFSFYVEDLKKPTLEIIGNLVKVAFAGDKFIMPKVNASDDNTEDLEVFAIIVDTNNKYSYIGDDGYTFSTSGTYKVIIGVFDEEGNLTKLQYYVEVK